MDYTSKFIHTVNTEFKSYALTSRDEFKFACKRSNLLNRPLKLVQFVYNGEITDALQGRYGYTIDCFITHVYEPAIMTKMYGVNSARQSSDVLVYGDGPEFSMLVMQDSLDNAINNRMVTNETIPQLGNTVYYQSHIRRVSGQKIDQSAKTSLIIDQYRMKDEEFPIDFLCGKVEALYSAYTESNAIVRRKNFTFRS